MAIAEYNKYTCIRWIPRTNEEYYVDITNYGGCFSYLGRQYSNITQMNLGSGCLNVSYFSDLHLMQQNFSEVT